MNIYNNVICSALHLGVLITLQLVSCANLIVSIGEISKIDNVGN